MSFQFRSSQILDIQGLSYIVTGGIEFRGDDGSVWQEYALTSSETRKIAWLTMDERSHEYCLFQSEYDHSRFQIQALMDAGFYLNAEISARVINYFGAVDVDRNEHVRTREYLDETHHNIVSIEMWGDETEYSSGIYLNPQEIVPQGFAPSGFGGMPSGGVAGTLGNAGANVAGKMPGIIIAIVIFLAAVANCFPGSCSCSSSDYSSYTHQDTTIREHIQGNARYRYETAVTSDLNENERADVYSTDASVSVVAKALIAAVAMAKPDAQSSNNDETVTILTPTEYAVVYKDKDDPNRTLVQISNREYAYESSNTLYQGSEAANHHYRSFYFIRAFPYDSGRFSSRTSGYTGYQAHPGFRYNPNNTYQSYADNQYKAEKTAREKRARSKRQQSRSTRNTSRSTSRSSSRRMGK